MGNFQGHRSSLLQMTIWLSVSSTAWMNPSSLLGMYPIFFRFFFFLNSHSAKESAVSTRYRLFDISCVVSSIFLSSFVHLVKLAQLSRPTLIVTFFFNFCFLLLLFFSLCICLSFSKVNFWKSLSNINELLEIWMWCLVRVWRPISKNLFSENDIPKHLLLESVKMIFSFYFFFQFFSLPVPKTLRDTPSISKLFVN